MRRLSLAMVPGQQRLFPFYAAQADGTRYGLAVESGGQSMAQLQSRLADPGQEPQLEARPLCWMPVLAPFTDMQERTAARLRQAEDATNLVHAHTGPRLLGRCCVPDDSNPEAAEPILTS